MSVFMRKNVLTVCGALIVECLLFVFLVYLGKQYVMSATLCLLSILAFEIIIMFLFRDETKKNCIKKACYYLACVFFVNLIVFFMYPKVSREMGYGHALYVITLFEFSNEFDGGLETCEGNHKIMTLIKRTNSIKHTQPIIFGLKYGDFLPRIAVLLSEPILGDVGE